MKLSNPAGWWAFGSLALLLLSFLFRAKPVQRTVSNLYLWRLAEKHLKKQLPVQRLKKTLIALLQILLLAGGAFFVMQPLLELSGSGVEFYAVLDASASMRIKGADGARRFEKAKEKLEADVRALPFGSTISIVSSDAPDVFLAERTKNKNEALQAISMASCGWGDGNLTGLLEAAQVFVWQHPNAAVSLYTDQRYSLSSGLQIVPIEADGAWNVSLRGLSYSDQGEAVFTHSAVSSGQDAEVMLGLYLDDELQFARTVKLQDGVEQAISWSIDGGKRFQSAKVVAAVSDGLDEDNACYYFSASENVKNVLLVSRQPFYWRHVLSVFPSIRLAITERPAADAVLSGYDLYILDGWMPRQLPRDGSLWLANPPSLPKDGEVALGEVIRGAGVTVNRALADSEWADVTAHILCRDMYLLKFREFLSTGPYTTLLQCGELPVVMACKEENNLRRVLFAFDLHDTNLPLLSDFVYLTSQLLTFTLPDMLSRFDWEVGEDVHVNALPLYNLVYLLKSDQSVVKLPLSDGSAGFTAEAPGVYTLIQQKSAEDEASAKFVRFSVSIPPEESRADQVDTPIVLGILSPELSESQQNAIRDENLLDPKRLLAALLMILAVAEWAVYYHEQF